MRRLEKFAVMLLINMGLSSIGICLILGPIFGFPVIAMYSFYCALAFKQHNYMGNVVKSLVAAITLIIAYSLISSIFLTGFLAQSLGILLIIFLQPLIFDKLGNNKKERLKNKE